DRAARRIGYAIGMTSAKTPWRARRAAPPEPAPDPAVEPDGTVTGVARGGLGTAANLEDTQLYAVEDLQALPAPARVAAPAVAVAQPTTVTPVSPAAVTPATVTRATVTRAVPGPGPRGLRLTGGAIAAVVLAAVVGGATLLALAGGAPGRATSPTDALASLGATFALETAPANGGAGGGGGGNGGGNGHGGGGGNGGGNGHGH
ncbi:MAG TPA: hypothetical protein VFI15_05000, partial [Candidatus Limnocylindrales bacterium]|nr:hypothetical protein [Candidatus Limnocylindrales bacterium]